MVYLVWLWVIARQDSNMSLPNTFIDNKSRFAPQTTVGFKISKPGFNATNTLGSNFLFNSSWPSLPIIIDIPNTTGGNISHTLKFPPFAIVWSYVSDPSGIGTVVTSSMLATDNQFIYAGTLTPPNRLLVFNLDLSKDVDYVFAPGDTSKQSYDPNFGVKVVKKGKDINSKDLRDFTIHSRAQSPLILAVKTQDTISPNTIPAPPGPDVPVTVVQYTTKGTIPTWNYGFIKSSAGVYTPAPLFSQTYPRIFTDGLVTYLQYASPDIGATLVILRDPIFAPNQVTIQY